jgi:hypothetical protein
MKNFKDNVIIWILDHLNPNNRALVIVGMSCVDFSHRVVPLHLLESVANDVLDIAHFVLG